MGSHRRDRTRKPGRREPFRERKPRILVVCEGVQTEPEYLKSFAKAFRNSRVEVFFEKERGVPRTLIDIAKQRKKEAEKSARKEKDSNLEFDRVWIVFDVDEHPNIPETLQMARDSNISVAMSNPSFELWILLHYRESPGMKSRQDVLTLVEKAIPDYGKLVHFSQCKDGYEMAVKRARRLDETAVICNDPQMNPTTGVYLLTESIREE